MTVTTALVDDAVTESPAVIETAATVPAIELVSVANGSLLCASATFASARSIAAWSARIVAAEAAVVVALPPDGLLDGLLDEDGVLGLDVGVLVSWEAGWDAPFDGFDVVDCPIAVCSAATDRSSASARGRSACCWVSVAV